MIRRYGSNTPQGLVIIFWVAVIPSEQYGRNIFDSLMMAPVSPGIIGGLHLFCMLLRTSQTDNNVFEKLKPHSSVRTLYREMTLLRENGRMRDTAVGQFLLVCKSEPAKVQ